jgi:microsomal dipeptidase-like Zn-dependent dipeptidase
VLNLDMLPKTHATLAWILLVALTAAELSAQNGTMRGFADIHNHQFANHAFGGFTVAGSPYGEISDSLSPASCLRTAQGGHSFGHIWDILGGYFAGYPGAINYPNDGYPTFNGWPAFFEAEHQKVHEDFLRRAVDGGLRLMVMLAVESHKACQAVVNGGGRTDGRNCNNEMSSINAQLDDAVAMQKEIDGKAGGDGQGWYRIVATPAQAREVILQGKLAVVLGVETSQLFNCHSEPCDWGADQNLPALWRKGVRHFFPIHHGDNAFGGPSYFSYPLQNGPNLLNVPSYKLDLHPCADAYNPGPLKPSGCNTLGLTATGKAFIQELMRRGAMIDVDHMSDRSFSDTLDLAEAQGYPVIASHAGFNEIDQRTQNHEGQLTSAELSRIQGVGGMVGLISSQGDIYTVGTYKRPPGLVTLEHNCGRSSETFAQAYYYAIDHYPGMPIAIGTDFNGPLRQVGPRFGSRACDGSRSGRPDSTTELSYSFLARGSNLSLPRLTTGKRTWDFNFDGLAHEGLIPDMFADLEVLGVAPDDLEPMFNSAEGYIRVWERACLAEGGPTDGCGTDLNFAGITITTGAHTYRAANSLTASSASISGAASITFQAPNYIRLAPEFRATAGDAAVTLDVRVQ